MFWMWYQTRWTQLTLSTWVHERYLPFRGWRRGMWDGK